MIRIQGLHKFFNKGRQNEIHVINDVNLTLPEKGMVAIFGKSGCGKTTLLNVIGGLDKFAEGSLTIENQDIRENTDDIRNKYIGYIFQNYNLNKAETCFENVADALRLCGMSDSAEIEARVTAALTNVGMEKYSKRTPDTLSGGQQQRIAIARAIVKNPRIILADEPTGNLDEANTVMIMDLLKAIAKDHLILLVTHEANLVDYYCDTVIELSDGKVAGVKKNSAANGFAARDKNDIYLGELKKSGVANENAEIEYYGDAPSEPVKLKIVNNGGKLYIQINTAKVQILDEFSEVKLREGVYEEKAEANSVSQSVDMSKLPPVQGTRFGRLFSLRSSAKSGYEANFQKGKKGKNVLRNCMCLFAAVIVFMSAVFGTAFGDISSARNSYNHNTFYLYTGEAEVSQKLAAAVGSAETGIDYIRLSGNYPSGDSWVYFGLGNFETFRPMEYESNFRTNAVYLDLSLARDLPLAEGKKEGLDLEEILISTKVADALLEKSTLGYITDYEDLIGLVSTMFTVDGKKPRIAGIVESEEPAIYLTELAMAKYVHGGISSEYTTLASDYGIEIAKGETVLAIKEPRDGVEYPNVGETIKINGIELKVTEIKKYCKDYSLWLEENGIKKTSDYEYFTDIVKAEHRELDENSTEFVRIMEKVMSERYYEYYDYYYSEIESFCRDLYFFDRGDIYCWLYIEKGIEEVKYIFLPQEYYKAVKYKELYGRYPTTEEFEKAEESLPYIYDIIYEYQAAYEDEFYYGNRYNNAFYNNTYIVSDSDYISFAKQIGETHPSASSNNTVYDDSYFEICYTVIHSSDPEKTQAWLESEFAYVEAPTEFLPAFVTPDSIFEDIIAGNLAAIITSLVAMVLILVLMSVCMYFIMRSSLMSRIKEVGIYRAIGVSKKNLVFKFFIEALVLTTLTVFIGYICTSAFLFLCLGMSSLVAEIFYYPLWLAGAVLVVLYALSLFCGTLPILSLLRKTPSEILAKYDI